MSARPARAVSPTPVHSGDGAEARPDTAVTAKLKPSVSVEGGECFPYASSMLARGPAPTPIIWRQSKQAAAGFISAEEDVSDGVLDRDQVLSEVNATIANIPHENLGQFLHDFRLMAAALSDPQSKPQPDQPVVAQAADPALAKVKGDATLLRQWHKYQQLLTAVVLPPDGQLFETSEEAANASNLAKTYFRLWERQAKVGVKLVPENESYIRQVASVATLSYQKLKPKPDALVA